VPLLCLTSASPLLLFCLSSACRLL
jgi:hypothetical protein